MSKNQEEIQREIFKKYDLVYNKDDAKNSDVFITPRYKIITRSGIDKIEARLKANTTFDVVFIDPFEIIVKGTFNVEGVTIETFGEASVDRKEIVETSDQKTESGAVISRGKAIEILLKKGNVGQNPPYLAAMAEKRARSRGVLRLAGLYDLGFYGEDEADSFSGAITKERSKVSVS